MRKLERFLDDFGPLFKLAIIITWVLWGLQTTGSMKELFLRKNNMSWEEEQTAIREVDALSMKFGKEAEKLGENYTPEKYFNHLWELKKFSHEKGVGPSPRMVDRFQKIFHQNFNNRRFTSEEVEEAGLLFKKRYESIQEPANLPTLYETLFWAITMYLRTMLLVTPYYFLTMISRYRSMAETLLAGKAKFIAAVFLWPVFFFRYPNNVVREIRVEAELRRLKGLFRKLSPKELRLVQEIANDSAKYKRWLTQKRNYKRSLAIALLITILINLLPTVLIVAQLNKTISISCSERTDNDIGQNNPPPEAIIEPQIQIPPQQIIAKIEETEEVWESVAPDKIERIPLLPLSDILNILTITKTAKGHKNENAQNFSSNNNFNT